MKYLITKTELKSEDKETVILKDKRETDNLELTREELHQQFKCDRVLFHYEEIG